MNFSKSCCNDICEVAFFAKCSKLVVNTDVPLVLRLSNYIVIVFFEEVRLSVKPQMC